MLSEVFQLFAQCNKLHFANPQGVRRFAFETGVDYAREKLTRM